MINYNQKSFAAISNTANGESSVQTHFHYLQDGKVLTGHYSGGDIIKGQLIGLVNEKGVIDMRYHHINTQGEIKTGVCHSVPEILENGKIRLHEQWQWTSGDRSIGRSIIEEL